MTDTVQHSTPPTGTRPDGKPGEPGESGRHAGDGATAADRRRTVLLVAALVSVAGAIPLAVALGVLHQPRWYPILDLAQTELRVRDVPTRHAPLVGLAGRFYAFDTQGSHLGPLSFWSLWPFYALFGGTAWALQAASASLNLLAMSAATWIAHRRGGPRAALAAAAALAVLARAYGAAWLTEAWNPYMPMLWWVVFLLAVWSVLGDDLAMLPVAVFAGSFCVQTHIPYLGLVGGMGALTVGAVAWWFVPRRRDPDARRRLLTWGGAALGLLAVLWTPPLIDSLINDPSNVGIVRETFAHPDDPAVGLRRAAEIWTSNLDVRVLIERAGDSGDAASGGVSVPGLALLAVWAGAVVTAWRRRYDDVLRLHLVVGAALVLGLVSISRILGMAWYYLVLWSLGTTTLLVVATLWTYLSLLSASSGTQQRQKWVMVALGGALAVAAASFTYDAAHTEVPAAEETRTLRQVAPEAIRALRAGDAPGGGQDGRYLVRWEDALGIGAQGYGFLLELERQGFDVGVTDQHRTGAVAHRVRPLDEATATVNYVNGDAAIARWDAIPEAERIAYLEPKTPAEQDRFDRLHDELVAGLRDAGLDDLVPTVGTNLFVVGLDQRVPAELGDKVTEMMDLGLPTAVYVAPPTVG